MFEGGSSPAAEKEFLEICVLAENTKPSYPIEFARVLLGRSVNIKPHLGLRAWFCIWLQIMVSWTGITAVTAYSPVLLNAAGYSSLKQNGSAGGLNTIAITGTIISAQIVDRLDRRKCMIGEALGVWLSGMHLPWLLAFTTLVSTLARSFIIEPSTSTAKSPQPLGDLKLDLDRVASPEESIWYSSTGCHAAVITTAWEPGPVFREKLGRSYILSSRLPISSRLLSLYLLCTLRKYLGYVDLASTRDATVYTCSSLVLNCHN